MSLLKIDFLKMENPAMKYIITMMRMEILLCQMKDLQQKNLSMTKMEIKSVKFIME